MSNQVSRVLDALQQRPGLLFGLLVQAREVKVAGPWVVTGGVARRCEPDGKPVAEVEPEGTHWRSVTPTREDDGFTSRANAMASADEHLREAGWLLDPMPPTDEEMEGSGEREVSAWRDCAGGGQRVCRRDEADGTMVAMIARSSTLEGIEVFLAEAGGRPLCSEDGDATVFRTLDEAKGAVEFELREQGFALVEDRPVPLGPWTGVMDEGEVPFGLPIRWRKRMDGQGTAVTDVMRHGDGRYYVSVGHRVLHGEDDKVAWFDTVEDAMAAADGELAARGFSDGR